MKENKNISPSHLPDVPQLTEEAKHFFAQWKDMCKQNLEVYMGNIISLFEDITLGQTTILTQLLNNEYLAMNMVYFILDDKDTAFLRYSYLYDLYAIVSSFSSDTRQEFLSRITLGRYEHFHSKPNDLWNTDDILLALWNEATLLKKSPSPLILDYTTFHQELIGMRDKFYALEAGKFRTFLHDVMGNILQSIDWAWESGNIEKARKEFNTLSHIYTVIRKYSKEILPLFQEIDVLKHGIKKWDKREKLPYTLQEGESWLFILQTLIDDVLADNLSHD